MQTFKFCFAEVPKLHLDGLLGRKIRVRAGEPINIVIPLSGAPKPKVEWMKGKSPVTESYRVSVRISCKDVNIFKTMNSLHWVINFFS